MPGPPSDGCGPHRGAPDLRPIGKNCEVVETRRDDLTDPPSASPARDAPRGGSWHSGDPATQLAPRPSDATLTVTKAARLLGVHPNTVRAWSDQGRLRFYRINDRGDRRYRLGDLQRFLAAAEQPAPAGRPGRGLGATPRPIPSIGAEQVELRTRPSERPTTLPEASPADGRGRGAAGAGLDTTDEAARVASAGGAVAGFRLPDTVRPAGEPPSALPLSSPLDVERRLVEIDILGRLADLIASGRSLEETATAAADLLHGRAGHDLAVVLVRRDGRLAPVAGRGQGADQVSWIAKSAGLPGRALTAPGPVSEVAAVGHDWLAIGHRLPSRIAVAVPGGGGRPWGVLVTADETPPATIAELETFLVAIARQLGVAVHAERLRAETSV